MKRENLKKEFIAVANKYIAAFEKKHKMELEFWVSDDVGGVASFGDTYFFSFDDIRLDVDSGAPKHLILDWSNDRLDEHYAAEGEKREERHINFNSYRTGLRFKDLPIIDTGNEPSLAKVV